MKKKKLIIITIFLFIIIMIMAVIGIKRLGKKNDAYTIEYQDTSISSLSPLFYNDKLYFPITDIENLGAIINYEPSHEQVVIYIDDKAVYAQVGTNSVEVSKKKILLSNNLVKTEDGIIVPKDFFNKVLGVYISVDDEKRIITVSGSQAEEESELDLPSGVTSIQARKSANLISDNLRYDYTSRTLIIKKKSSGKLNVETVDKSIESRYIIKTDISGLAEGDFSIDDDYIKSVEVSGDEVEIHPKRLLDYAVEEDKDCLYICPAPPRERYKNVVVIDAGHGGIDPGTIYEDIVEKEINLDVSQRLFKLLEQDEDIKVYPTRSDDTYYTTNQRADFGNAIGDLFVSIHINSYSDDQSVNGPEVWYYHHGDDSFLGNKCKTMAEITQTHIINDLKLRKRELQINNFDVLVLTDIPAILCEMGFMTNPEDGKMLKDEEFRQNFAQALYDSIKDTLADETVMAERTDSEETTQSE